MSNHLSWIHWFLVALCLKSVFFNRRTSETLNTFSLLLTFHIWLMGTATHQLVHSFNSSFSSLWVSLFSPINTYFSFQKNTLFEQTCGCLCFRHRFDIFPRHPQLPRPDAGWVGHPMGAHVCHRHVVSQEIPSSDVQEGQVHWPS